MFGRWWWWWRVGGRTYEQLISAGYWLTKINEYTTQNECKRTQAQLRTFTVHFIRFAPTTVQYHKHLISQLDGRKSMLTLSRWPTDIQTQQQYDGGRIGVTLNVACLSVRDRAVWVFHKLPTYQDFHPSHLYGYSQSKMRQYPVICNSLVACLDEDESTWSRSLVKDDCWLFPFLNNSSVHVHVSVDHNCWGMFSGVTKK